jgi:hypothetical protein
MRCDNIIVQSNEYIHQPVVVEEDDNINLKRSMNLSSVRRHIRRAISQILQDKNEPSQMTSSSSS